MVLLRGVSAVAVLLSVAAVAAQERRPIEDLQLRGGRFRGLHYREMTPEQRVMLDHTVNSARAVTNTTANGPFNVLVRSPEVGNLSQALGNAVRFSSSLTGRMRELVILTAGRAWSSAFEWYAHAAYAVQEGMAPAVLAALADNRQPDRSAMAAEEWAAWQVSDELLYTRRVSDATFDAARAALGEERLVSAVTLAAYYEYVSMILNVDRYPLPADAPPGSDRAIRRLPTAALARAPVGGARPRSLAASPGVTAALDALAVRIAREEELPAALRAALGRIVAEYWASPGRVVAPRNATAVERFAVEILTTREVSDATFAAALQQLGERRLVNALVALGSTNIRCARAALGGRGC